MVRGETNFFVWKINQDIKRVLYSYPIIAQKLLMLKQIIKIVLNFIEHVHYPSFFVQFICYVTSYLGASLYDAYVKKEKCPWEKFGTYAFVHDLPWHKGWGSCFKSKLFEKLVLWFYSKEIWQKKFLLHTHTNFLHRWWLLGKKE